MSNAMNTVEIEDVLSSIRRLVSEDLRPTHRLVSAALENGASKLILTPALRVVADVSTALPEGGDALDHPRDLQTVLLDIGSDDDVPSPQLGPMFGSVRLSEQPELINQAGGQSGQGDRATAGLDADFLTTAMSRINGLSAGSAAAGQSETLGSVVAAVGAAVGPDEWEPDGGEPVPQGLAWADTEWNSDAGEVVSSEMATDGLVSEAALQVDEDGAPFAQDADDVDAGDAMPSGSVLILATTQTDDVASSQDALSPLEPVAAHVDAVGQVSADQSLPLADLDDFAGHTDDHDDDTGYLNEDVLRAIIADMIREELQGPLGERITRNVRKLVRSEINRALATRDFEDVATRR